MRNILRGVHPPLRKRLTPGRVSFPVSNKPFSALENAGFTLIELLASIVLLVIAYYCVCIASDPLHSMVLRVITGIVGLGVGIPVLLIAAIGLKMEYAPKRKASASEAENDSSTQFVPSNPARSMDIMQRIHAELEEIARLNRKQHFWIRAFGIVYLIIGSSGKIMADRGEGERKMGGWTNYTTNFIGITGCSWESRVRGK